MTSDGSMSAVNWMRAKRPPIERARAGRERGLAHAGHVLDEQVAAREEADHREAYHAGLADDAAGDVLLEGGDQVEVVGHSVLRRRVHGEEEERGAPRIPHVVAAPAGIITRPPGPVRRSSFTT